MTPVLPGQIAYSTAKHFELYKKDIHHVLDSYPSIVELRPSNLSPATYATAFTCLMRVLIHPDCQWLNGPYKERMLLLAKAGYRPRPNIVSGIVTFSEKVDFILERKTGIGLSTLEGVIDARDPAILTALLVLKNADLLSSHVQVIGIDKSQLDSLSSLYPNTAIHVSSEGIATIY